MISTRNDTYYTQIHAQTFNACIHTPTYTYVHSSQRTNTAMSVRVNSAAEDKGYTRFGYAGEDKTICDMDANALRLCVAMNPFGFIVKGGEEQLTDRRGKLGIIGCRGLWFGLQELQFQGESWFFVAKGFNVGYERHLAFIVPMNKGIEPTDQELRKFVLEHRRSQVMCRQHGCCCCCCGCDCRGHVPKAVVGDTRTGMHKRK